MKSDLAELFDQHAGNLSLTDAKIKGFNAKSLDRLVKRKELEKVAPGFYIRPGIMIDDLYLVQSIYKRGVFSHETALDIFQLSTNLPNEIHMTFPKGYNVSKSKFEKYNIRSHYSVDLYYSIGIETSESFYGNKILVYDKERTICDMWNARYKTNVEIKEQALKEYMESSDRDMIKLRQYMSILPVSKEMKMFLKALY